MSSLYIGLIVLYFIVICESLPVDRTDVDIDREWNTFNEDFDEFVSETGFNTVQRNKRSLMNSDNCPEGKVKFPSGYCEFCNGRDHPDCPVVKDYQYVNG